MGWPCTVACAGCHWVCLPSLIHLISVLNDARKPHPSRYTFIICCDKISTASTKIDPDSLRSEYEGKPGELGKPTQDIIDRMGFNTERFLMKNNLDAIAATFMFVEGSLKSGMNNAALAATAMANKVMGR